MTSRMRHRIRRMRLLTAVPVLGLAGSMLALVATPASASPTASTARAAHHASPVAHTSSHPIGLADLRRSAIPDVTSNASFQMFNENSHLCLGIYQGRDDAPAIQWTCNGNPDQTWHWGSADSLGGLQLVNGDNQCLGVAGASPNEGAQVVGWTCLGPTHPDQYWYPIGEDCADPDYSELINYNTAYVLGIAGNSTNLGAPAVQWPTQYQCNNQDWLGPGTNTPN